MKLAIVKLFFFLQYLRSKKYPQEKRLPDAPEKILLIMCKWIGDTFWDLQVIPELKKQFPDAEIHVLVKPFSKFLFRGILPKQQIHVSSQVLSDCRREPFSFRQWKQDLNKIRSIKPELVFDFTETPFSAVFASMTGTEHIIGYDHLGRFSNLYTSRKHAEYGLHLSRRPMALIGKEVPFPQVIPQVPDPVIPGVDVMIFPSAGWKIKEYPPEKYHLITESLTEKGLSVCICGSPKEKELCERIGKGLKNVRILTDSMEDMLRTLASAKICLSGDTGPAHIAAAMGKYTIALFCGTNPEFCGPLGENITILQSTCPDIPEGKTQFCPADRRFPCRRTCFMNIEPEKIVSLIVGFTCRMNRNQ